MKISTFKINDELYGVDVLLIKEISNITEIVKVPGATYSHYGLMNLRGNVISIIHPEMFTMEKKDIYNEKQKIIIFKNNENLKSLVEKKLLPEKDYGSDYIGLLIDEVHDVIEIEKNDIKELSKNLSVQLLSVLEGVVTYSVNEIKMLVLILSHEKFLKEIGLVAQKR